MYIPPTPSLGFLFCGARIVHVTMTETILIQCKKQFLNKVAAPRLTCTENSKEVVFIPTRLEDMGGGWWEMVRASLRGGVECGLSACAQARSPAEQRGGRGQVLKRLLWHRGAWGG